jgi:hypothetical protein
MLVVDELLFETGRRGTRRAADAAWEREWFAAHLAELRGHHHRPTLIAMLDKASLD